MSLRYRVWVHLLAAIPLVVFLSACATTGGAGGPDIERRADRLLGEMSDALASADPFMFDTEERRRTLSRDGEYKTQFLSRRVLVDRPNAIRFQVRRFDGEREFWMKDGRLTMVDYAENVFSTMDVPATLDECLDFLAEWIQVPMPVSDILYSSPYDALISSGTRGGVIGTDYLNGFKADHLAFTHDVVDFEIWIRSEGPALPVRLKIRQKWEGGASESVINFRDWRMDLVLAPDVFDAKVPEGFEQIPMQLRDPSALTATEDE